MVWNSLLVKDFDLDRTMLSGQHFLWKKNDLGYLIQNNGVVFEACQERDGTLRWSGCEKEWLESFFRLDQDMTPIKRVFENDPALRETMDFCWGIRLMRQDPWECLVSFICSTQSKVKRTLKLIDRLCDAMGQRTSRDDVKLFPGLDRWSQDESIFKHVGAGYRSKYLARLGLTSIEILNEARRESDSFRAREILKKLFGVGNKVADCVLLFSMDRLDVCPVDVWIRKVVKRLTGKELTYHETQAWMRDRFGENAGLAQQFLYHNARMSDLIV